MLFCLQCYWEKRVPAIRNMDKPIGKLNATGATCTDYQSIDETPCFFSRSVRVANDACSFSGLIQQCFNGAAGAAAGFGFEHLAEQNESGDDGGGFEVERNDAIYQERGREGIWKEERNDAEDVASAYAESDEREHVQVAIHERFPAANEEGPAGPDDGGGAKSELEPLVAAWRYPVVYVERNVVAETPSL
jgi:hypothetical protein